MMWFSLIVFIISTVVGVLYIMADRHKPWQSRSGRQAALQVHLAVYTNSLRLLWYGCNILLIVAASLIVEEASFWAGLLSAGAVVVALQLVVNLSVVQRWVMQQTDHLWQKYRSQLNWLSVVMRPLQAAGERIFTESPLYTSEAQFRRFMAYQQEAFGALPPDRFAQFTQFLELEKQSLSEVVVPIATQVVLHPTDLLGPLLLSQLHESTRKVFVVQSKKGQVVGTLAMESAVGQLWHNQLIGKVMNEHVVTIDEAASLQQTLQLFQESTAQLLVVVDKHKHPKGVVYLTDALQRLLPAA